MSENFKSGDVVQLKSGGPAMTVDSQVAGGKVQVIWFVDKELRAGTVHADALRVWKEPEAKKAILPSMTR